MYKKILIANRGEIAIRIIRACREMGIKTVAIYSTVDINSLHVKLADQSMCIGPADSKQSYLKIPAIIAAAEVTGAEAIHPGYGFLSEDGDFVEKCIASNIDFIGPSAKIIKNMGDKITGRKQAIKSKVPVTPGTKDSVKKVEDAHKIALDIGFPIMIKASAGGGGKGMRAVHSAGSLTQAYNLAQAEAEAAFGNGDVFIEKFIEEPRHIEVQILGDKHGNVVHLGERDCSIQRRNQKIIEEAPAHHFDDKIRERICTAAVNLAKSIGYDSVGTIEFLMNSKTQEFYFMEMNTRLQVEHPVTEYITGIDLVKEQIQVAYGEKLKIKQEDIHFKGHSIECRIIAEDPDTFQPSPGRITLYREPGGPGVRVDTFAHQDCLIVPNYDSMIAKLIVYGDNRNEAIKKMNRTLIEYEIEGIKTSIPLHKRILMSLRYQEGKINTNFVQHFVIEK